MPPPEVPLLYVPMDEATARGHDRGLACFDLSSGYYNACERRPMTEAEIERAVASRPARVRDADVVTVQVPG